MADVNCHKVLMQALDFDEAGNKVVNVINIIFFDG